MGFRGKRKEMEIKETVKTVYSSRIKYKIKGVESRERAKENNNDVL